MFDPKIFYLSYLTEYHKFKIIPITKILAQQKKYEVEFFGNELTPEDSAAYHKTLKSDLRQTYFHSIETLFEILFALSPTEKKGFDDENILLNITNSNQKETFNRIQKIAKDISELDYLDNSTTLNSEKISIGHYLFYFGILPNNKFPNEMFDEMKNSLESIKLGLQIIAKDFSNREEYNSYKHGLRIIPALKQFAFAAADNLEIKLSWNLSESMSFYYRTKNPDELKMVTKLFDTERDYHMAYFCSNLIFNMVYFRRLHFYKESIKDDKIPILMFGKDEIEKCNKINVEMQDLVWTVRRVYDEKKE